jgi:hypothetical protein
MWLTMALNNWKWIVIGFLTFALALSTLHGRALKAERDAKTAEIDSMRNAAQTYKDQSEITAKEISDAHSRQLVAAKENAFANFKARYGTGNAACGIRANSLPTKHDSGQADSTSTPDERPANPMADFVGQCAETTVLYNEWRELARRNEFNISKE